MSTERARRYADGGGILAWDGRVAAAAALATALAFALAVVVTAATDEGGVAWGERLARTLPALPACAGFAAWIALQARRARGELRVLATLGRSPARACLGAFAGASIAGAALTFAIATRPSFDASALFPVAHTGVAVHFEDGAFVEDATGLRILPDGSIQRPPAAASPPEAASAARAGAGAGADTGTGAQRGAAIVVVLLATWALALLGARGSPRRKDWVAVAAAAALTVLLFHAVAVGRIAPALAVAPTIGLFAFAILRYGEDEAWPNAV